jgi:hypothetical protein
MTRTEFQQPAGVRDISRARRWGAGRGSVIVHLIACRYEETAGRELAMQMPPVYVSGIDFVVVMDSKFA